MHTKRGSGGFVNFLVNKYSVNTPSIFRHKAVQLRMNRKSSEQSRTRIWPLIFYRS